jgi:O-antigen ligase
MRADVSAIVFDRSRWARAADFAAVAVAVSLPWSTTATGILIVVWLAALLPTVTVGDMRRVLAEPAGGLPVALWLLGLVGMLWSTDVSLREQLYALKGFHKLLVIPLLLVQFQRSDKGYWVLGGFLASCTVLMAVSWAMHAWPSLLRSPRWPGVPVKDYLVQSIEFLVAAFAAAHVSVTAWSAKRRALAALLAALAVLFLLNVTFVAAGRTVLAALPVLLLLFGAQRFGWKGVASLTVVGVLTAGLLWTTSPYFRARAYSVVQEVRDYRAEDSPTSAGYRLLFWTKSIGFVAEAPLLGHGTGTIPRLFERGAAGKSGLASVVTGNPHNQTLEIAVQFGLIGLGILYALWLAQILMFRGGGLPGWLGMGVVAHGIVGSIFLSYLFDFTTGWMYAFGVGVLGGMALAHKRGPDMEPVTRTGAPQP